MSATSPATSASPKPPALNRLGHEQKIYKAAESTLCAGCGHDSITSQLIKALFEMDVEPWNVAKMSGIGCSSKTTAYFLGQSFGFNSLHENLDTTTPGGRLIFHVFAALAEFIRELIVAGKDGARVVAVSAGSAPCGGQSRKSSSAFVRASGASSARK